MDLNIDLKIELRPRVEPDGYDHGMINRLRT